MLITDKFVFLHLPKTGGTFVVDAVSLYYGGYQLGLPVNFAVSPPAPGQPFCFRSRNKHLSRRRIPPRFQHLPVMGTIRNPFARYVSQYRFGTWRIDTAMFPQLANHPDFPDISFGDYVRLANEHLWLVAEPARFQSRCIGWQTASLMQWYGRPEALDGIRPRTTLDALAIRAGLDPIVLLDMDRLNQDLYHAMCAMGYERRKIEFMLKLPKIYPAPAKPDPEAAHLEIPVTDPSGESGSRPAANTRTLTEIPQPDSPPWESYYDAGLKRFVRDRERYLFELFPQWDV